MTSILLDGVPTAIAAKRITLLCHGGDVNLMPDGQVEIGPEQTIARANAVTPEEWALIREHSDFKALFKVVFPGTLIPTRLHWEGMGMRHITGMLLMLLELEPGKTPFMRYPESFLHPGVQSRLGDLFARLAGAG